MTVESTKKLLPKEKDFTAQEKPFPGQLSSKEKHNAVQKNKVVPPKGLRRRLLQIVPGSGCPLKEETEIWGGENAEGAAKVEETPKSAESKSLGLVK